MTVAPLGVGRRCVGWSLLTLLVLGCGARGEDGASDAGGAPTSTPAHPVVARVGDQVIDAEQVRRYVATHRVTPREALRALEDDALLLNEARRAGWRSDDPSAQARAEEQLLAQRVLLDIEHEHSADSLTADEVRAYHDEHVSEIVHEEQRECVQVLVQVPEGVSAEQDELARQYAERTLEQMRVRGVMEVWSAQPPQHHGMRVLSQYLPTATPSTEMPPAFRDGVFALSAPGPLASAVRTANGWHAVGVTAIHAPIEAGSARALDVARERLVTLRRRSALEARIRSLSERFSVSVSTPRIEAVLPSIGTSAGPAT